MRKAKIVATIGPASRDPRTLLALLKAGMDVARLNLAFGKHNEQAQVIRDLRRLSALHKCSVAILADLPGPKIRTGQLAHNQPVELRKGQQLILTGKKIVGNQERITITYSRLAQDVQPHARILLDDGSIMLRAQEIRHGEVVCQVLNGGLLRERKGVNLPDSKLKFPSVTGEDKKHLEFALRHGVDYIGQSFVRKAKDVRVLKALIERADYDTPVIAKIEKPEALDDLDAIIKVADGVMVARGDLGVEMDLEKVPSAQRKIIALANEERIPVITATQMMHSMIENPRPTRAEVADVSTAIAQGSGAVMLSGETSVGSYPREAVAWMSKIVHETETSLPPIRHRQKARNIPETVADAVALADDKYHMKAIVVFTMSGYSAQLVSKARPAAPIIAFTPRREICSRLALLWGVVPRYTKGLRNVDEFIPEAERRLSREKLVKKGDVIAIVTGTPLYMERTTNLLRFHTISK